MSTRDDWFQRALKAATAKSQGLDCYPEEMLGDAFEGPTPSRVIAAIPRLPPMTDMRAACHEYLNSLEQGRRTYVSLGVEDVDRSIDGISWGEMCVIAARPGHAKCLAEGTLVLLADGSRVPIEEVVRQKSEHILTLCDDWKIRSAMASGFLDNGIAEVYKVTFRSGRTIEATGNHPLRVLRGWRPVSNLSIGDMVACPRQIAVAATGTMPVYQLKILGYLIGDGSIGNRTPGFTNTNKRIIKDFLDSIGQFPGVEAKIAREGQWRISATRSDMRLATKKFAASLKAAVRRRGLTGIELAPHVGVSYSAFYGWMRGDHAPLPSRLKRLASALHIREEELCPEGLELCNNREGNSLTAWLRDLGLFGCKSREKFVPDCVFRLSNANVAIFLSRLFATDGHASVNCRGQATIGYCSNSERLVRDIQHLLLRFGILCTIGPRKATCNSKTFRVWRLEVTGKDNILRFVEAIGIYGKEDAVGRVAESANRVQAQNTNTDLLPMETWELLRLAKGGESWSSVARRAGLTGSRTNIHVGKRRLSRRRLAAIAAALESHELQDLAHSDVFWDEVVRIDPAGPKRVYDLTVSESRNFLANDIVVHNSAFALQWLDAAISAGYPSLLISEEMSQIELGKRMVCHVSDIDQEYWDRQAVPFLRQSVDQHYQGKAPLYVVENCNSIGVAEDVVDEACTSAGVKVVAVDYLQLLGSKGSRNRYEEVSDISRKLKQCAKRNNIALIVACQLNRAIEERPDHVPKASDLRECVTGDTRLIDASTGIPVAIRDVRPGDTVLCVDTSQRVIASRVADVWPTGTKPVFRITTRTGRTIKATANHPFLTPSGWTPLDSLFASSMIATAARWAERLDSETLRNWAHSDMLWEEVASIDPAGEEDVFDISIPGVGNFLANGIVTHNSGQIEQDSDLILLCVWCCKFDAMLPENQYVIYAAKRRNGPIRQFKIVTTFSADRQRVGPAPTGKTSIWSGE